MNKSWVFKNNQIQLEKQYDSFVYQVVFKPDEPSMFLFLFYKLSKNNSNIFLFILEIVNQPSWFQRNPVATVLAGSVLFALAKGIILIIAAFII